MPELLNDRRYLRQFDLYRVVGFLLVIAQHSILWPVTPSSPVGWAFVDFLHASRNLFFLLACLVATYAECFEKRGLIGGIKKRLGSILLPYATWTVVYFCFSIQATHLSANQLLPTLWHNAYKGYYQLYFLVVLAQIYVVLPIVWWIIKRTKSRHWFVFAVAFSYQFAMMYISHYGTSWRTGIPQEIRHYDIDLMASRYATGYLLYVVVGSLCAFHFDEVQALVERHWRKIVGVLACAFAVLESVYAVTVATGSWPGYESDLYQPMIVVWTLILAAGIWAVGWRWSDKSSRRDANLFDRAIEWLSDASEGFYLSHVLFLQLIFIALETIGLTKLHHWATMTVIIYPMTILVSGLFIWVAKKTPFRFALTGVDRSAQRARYRHYPEPRVDVLTGAMRV